ncbi:MAG: hypothetical protein ACRD1C_13540 [Terriglobales bacterium]
MKMDLYRIERGQDAGCYKVFQPGFGDEPMDEPNDDQLFGWLQARGYSGEEAALIIASVNVNGRARVSIPKAPPGESADAERRAALAELAAYDQEIGIG